MANALRLGYYALSPMTQAKSFRDNPVLGSAVLNRLGLHLFRVAAAAAFTRMRRAVLRPMISAADAQALQIRKIKAYFCSKARYWMVGRQGVDGAASARAGRL